MRRVASAPILETMASGRSQVRRKEERRIQAILDTAVYGIVTINEHGIVESANPAIERLFGYAPADLVGHKHLNAYAFSTRRPNWPLAILVRTALR